MSGDEVVAVYQQRYGLRTEPVQFLCVTAQFDAARRLAHCFAATLFREVVGRGNLILLPYRVFWRGAHTTE